jgi:hypothetical protein
MSDPTAGEHSYCDQNVAMRNAVIVLSVIVGLWVLRVLYLVCLFGYAYCSIRRADRWLREERRLDEEALYNSESFRRRRIAELDRELRDAAVATAASLATAAADEARHVAEDATDAARGAAFAKHRADTKATNEAQRARLEAPLDRVSVSAASDHSRYQYAPKRTASLSDMSPSDHSLVGRMEPSASEGFAPTVIRTGSAGGQQHTWQLFPPEESQSHFHFNPSKSASR